MSKQLAIGMLGAARIGYFGLLKPASEIPGVSVAAIAARDPARAQQYAQKHGIPLVHESYEALLADPNIEAIYNPLPNALHCDWSIKALDAGKHVLCEKPIANNAAEAKAMAAAAHRNGRVLMEAFHYRFHPLAARLCELVATLGDIQHIDVGMCFPLPMTNDIRFNYALAEPLWTLVLTPPICCACSLPPAATPPCSARLMSLPRAQNCCATR